MKNIIKKHKGIHRMKAMFQGEEILTRTPFQTLEELMGENLKDYETACVFEYNILGAMCAQHWYYKNEGWQRKKLNLKSLSKWNDSIFKGVAKLFCNEP